MIRKPEKTVPLPLHHEVGELFYFFWLVLWWDSFLALHETMESLLYRNYILFSMPRVSSLLFLNVHHLCLHRCVSFQSRVVSLVNLFPWGTIYYLLWITIFQIGNAILACLHLYVFRDSDYMLLVGVLEGITCGSFWDVASLLPPFSSSCWSWFYSFLFFFPHCSKYCAFGQTVF